MRVQCLVLGVAAVMLVCVSTLPLNEEDLQLVRDKRSAEVLMFGNHQNHPKVKKSDASVPVAPENEESVTELETESNEEELEDQSGDKASNVDSDKVEVEDEVEHEQTEADDNDKAIEDNTIDEESDVEKNQREKVIDELFDRNDDEDDDEESASRAAIEKMFSTGGEAPIAEDMTNDGKDTVSKYPDPYYYGYDYNYPELTDDTVENWAMQSAQNRRIERSAEVHPLTAEDMMEVVSDKKAVGQARSKRDLTSDEIRALLDGSTYTGEEYYNYPSSRAAPSYEKMEEEAFEPEVAIAPEEPGQAEYREYLEEVMNQALQDADIEERLEEAEREREEEEAEERAAYMAMLEAAEKKKEGEEQAQSALGLLRVLFKTIPDEEEEIDEPVVGLKEELGPGYRMEQRWEEYLPDGASVQTEELLSDFKPITYEGQEGIFIPMNKRSWSLSDMPGIKKRGGWPKDWALDEDNQMDESKRNYEEYGRLYRLARALRGDQWGDY